jgi:phosphoribosylpyrophosphate synthetase
MAVVKLGVGGHFTVPVYALWPYVSNRNATTEERQRLQRVVLAVKDGRRLRVGTRSVDGADRVVELIKKAPEVPAIFDGSPTLIPMPSSEVTLRPPSPATWPVYNLATALARGGLGRTAYPTIRRVIAVEKSSRARSLQDRTTIQRHIETLRRVGDLPDGPVVLVDDIVTTGTLIAAMTTMLRRAGYEGEVRAFATARTPKGSSDFQRNYEGTVSWSPTSSWADCSP